MKSYITVNLEGPLLIRHSGNNTFMIIVINGKKFELNGDTIGPVHTFPDPHPDRFFCQVELQVHDRNNKKKNETRILDSVTHRFKRKLNGYAKQLLPEKSLDPHFTKITLEYKNTEFNISEIDMMLGESILDVVEVPLPMGPSSISMYFWSYNQDQLQKAFADGDELVALLKIKHIVNLGNYHAMVYYQLVYDQLKKYPVHPMLKFKKINGVEQTEAEAESDDVLLNLTDIPLDDELPNPFKDSCSLTTKPQTTAFFC